MKTADLRERSTEDLEKLRDSLKQDLFGYRMKHHTGQLDDTSLLGKARKDIARIELVLHQRARATTGAEA
jgi:large subunit ribosomal protein L29